MSAPQGWTELLGRLEPYLSPEWSSHAREHGEQPWIRLILLVDAHHQLSTPRVAEKVAMTMADLAVDRDKEREGWEALRETAADQRRGIVAGLLDATPALLSPELVLLFERSIEPAPPGM